ncbi:hypothetical protein WBP_0838 [Wolbachia endosymbiont of Brugia pahangi]|nr:hypothetical protein WBP_0838 [Wolbachia endosymbiont of Brugia pahangi]
MDIINNFLIRSARNSNIKIIKLALSLHRVTNNLKKNSFRKSILLAIQDYLT